MKRIFTIIIIAFSIVACPSEGGGGGGGGGGNVNYNEPLSLSGSVSVLLDGKVKKYSLISVYSDSGLNNKLGESYVLTPSGTYETNDMYFLQPVPGPPIPPDGTWRIDIKERISAPITRIWIKAESFTNGYPSKIIERPIYLYDKSVSGINLGNIELPHSRINLTVVNNFTGYNSGQLVDGFLHILIYSLPANIGSFSYPLSTNIADFSIPYSSGFDGTYTFNTRTVTDTEKIFFRINGYVNPSWPAGVSDMIGITGYDLKSGYTLDGNNITFISP
jgi:hypothetical protein